MNVVKCQRIGLATGGRGGFVSNKTRCCYHVAIMIGRFAVNTEPKKEHCGADGMYYRKPCIGIEGTFNPSG